ncbi:hypothetical protein TIFTF001_014314 [Ficus carica]|uniref:Uncharacterized protein n=1 Tax=Ficus carica TaxID=3494 RepID=A0AA88AR62_FICCA|nr:hypothetical protein TIFTF001_014314 [Ficus carica]
MMQGSMTVLEAVKKFEQLARLCPELVPNETEKDKEARAQIFKVKKEEKAVWKQSQPMQTQELYPKGQTNNLHRIQSSSAGTKERGMLPTKVNRGITLRRRTTKYPNKNSSNQLHSVQAQIEGPSNAQGRLEAPEPQARIYAYTKGDVKARTSHVVTGQISISNFDAIALFDSSATHLFVSKEFAQKLGR